MGCGCSDHASDKAQQQVDELLDLVGLREVFSRGWEAINGAGRALVHLNRSERATALGFGSDVAELYSAAATRANERARDQMQLAMDRLDEVRRGDDWPRHVERVRAGFQEHDGAKRLDDMRADLRLRMLEGDPGLKAPLADVSAQILDRTIKAASEGDLDRLADRARRIMEYGLSALSSPEMGRQPFDPDMLEDPRGDDDPPPVRGGQILGISPCALWVACMAWAISSGLFATIVCAIFIACAAAPGIVLAVNFHVDGCNALWGGSC